MLSLAEAIVTLEADKARLERQLAAPVKALEWEEVPVSPPHRGEEADEVSHWAHHPFGSYAIERDYFSVIPWELVAGGKVKGHFNKLDDAKAAAQEDFEQRVCSLLPEASARTALTPKEKA